MFTRDFVMQQIQQLSQVLAAVLMKKKLDLPEEAREVMTNGLSDSFGTNLEEILQMDPEGLKELCSKDEIFLPDLAVALADLLLEQDSEVAEIQAFHLYTMAHESGGTLPLHVLNWIRSEE